MPAVRRAWGAVGSAAARRAARAYLGVLDAAFGAATEVTPKSILLADPAAREDRGGRRGTTRVALAWAFGIANSLPLLPAPYRNGRRHRHLHKLESSKRCYQFILRRRKGPIHYHFFQTVLRSLTRVTLRSRKGKFT
jgi:hypothetical protein